MLFYCTFLDFAIVGAVVNRDFQLACFPRFDRAFSWRTLPMWLLITLPSLVGTTALTQCLASCGRYALDAPMKCRADGLPCLACTACVTSRSCLIECALRAPRVLCVCVLTQPCLVCLLCVRALQVFTMLLSLAVPHRDGSNHTNHYHRATIAPEPEREPGPEP